MAAEDGECLGNTIGPRHHAVDEIGTVEGAHEHGRVAEPELAGDVLANPRRGRGSEGVEARLRKPLAEQGELPILRAEVVAPVADAVGLVDREPLHAHPRERVDEP